MNYVLYFCLEMTLNRIYIFEIAVILFISDVYSSLFQMISRIKGNTCQHLTVMYDLLNYIFWFYVKIAYIGSTSETKKKKMRALIEFYSINIK